MEKEKFVYYHCRACKETFRHSADWICLHESHCPSYKAWLKAHPGEHTALVKTDRKGKPLV